MINKNICIVSECQQIPGVGGTETVSFLLKKELKKNGFTVQSLFFAQKALLSEDDFLFPDGLDNITSSENKEFLTKTIIQNNIDIVLLQGVPNKGLIELCTEAKKLTNAKLVYSYHFNPLMIKNDYDDFKEWLLRRSKPFLRLLYNFYYEIKRPYVIRKSLKYFSTFDIDNIDAFVSLNKRYTDYFQSLYPQKHKYKFRTIANPITIEETEKTYKKENIVLFVGRLTFQKRLDRLLYIWKDLYNQYRDWRLIVVGNGNYSDKYKKIASELALENIEFVGQQPSEEYYKRSKIVCMTSSTESWGMVLIEAQKYGCVPIAFNSFDAVSDIIINNHNGILIKPFCKEAYADAIRKLMQNENLRNQLLKNGKEYIKKFDTKDIVKEWLSLFDSL